MGLKKHKANAPNKVNVGIITVSSTRSMKEDKSGHWISKRVKKEGHNLVFHQVVTDDAGTITETVHETISDYGAQVLSLIHI